MTKQTRQAAQRDLRLILTGLADALAAQDSHPLMAMIHFGSTASPVLKTETDVDVCLVFSSLPEGRAERNAFISPFEKRADEELRNRFSTEGRQLVLSVLTMTVNEVQSWHPFYLDLPSCSSIVFDPFSCASKLIAAIDGWIVTSGSRKVEAGLRWYWKLGAEPRETFTVDLLGAQSAGNEDANH